MGSVLLVVVAGLRWSAPATCPDAATFAEMVEGHLGGPMGDLDVEVSIEAVGEAWRAWIVTPEGGERVLDGKTCQDVADAAALVVALLDRPASSPPTSQPVTMPTVEPRGMSVPAVEVHGGEARRRTPFTLGIHLASTADVGALPGIAPGVTAGAVAGWRRLQLGVEGAYWPARAVSAPGQPEAGALIDLWSLAVRGSVGFGHLSPWVGVEAGAMRGSGTGVADARTRSAPWTAALAGLSYSFKLSRSLSIYADVGAAMPFSRPRFTLAGRDELHRPAALSARLAAGIAFQIP